MTAFFLFQARDFHDFSSKNCHCFVPTVPGNCVDRGVQWCTTATLKHSDHCPGFVFEGWDCNSSIQEEHNIKIIISTWSILIYSIDLFNTNKERFSINQTNQLSFYQIISSNISMFRHVAPSPPQRPRWSSSWVSLTELPVRSLQKPSGELFQPVGLIISFFSHEKNPALLFKYKEDYTQFSL